MRTLYYAVGVFGLLSCSSGNRYVEEREGVVCRNPATADQPIEMSYSFVTHRCWDGEKVGKPNQIKTFSGCRVFSKVDGTEKVWRNDAIASGSDCNVTTIEGREVLFQAKDNRYLADGVELQCVPKKQVHRETVSDTQDCSYGAPLYDEAFPLSPGPTCWGSGYRTEYVGATSENFESLRTYCQNQGDTFDTSHGVGGIGLREGDERPVPGIRGVTERIWGR
jgi:hypothetical protein